MAHRAPVRGDESRPHRACTTMAIRMVETATSSHGSVNRPVALLPGNVTGWIANVTANEIETITAHLCLRGSRIGLLIPTVVPRAAILHPGSKLRSTAMATEVIPGDTVSNTVADMGCPRLPLHRGCHRSRRLHHRSLESLRHQARFLRRLHHPMMFLHRLLRYDGRPAGRIQHSSIMGDQGRKRVERTSSAFAFQELASNWDPKLLEGNRVTQQGVNSCHLDERTRMDLYLRTRFVVAFTHQSGRQSETVYRDGFISCTRRFVNVVNRPRRVSGVAGNERGQSEPSPRDRASWQLCLRNRTQSFDSFLPDFSLSPSSPIQSSEDPSSSSQTPQQLSLSFGPFLHLLSSVLRVFFYPHRPPKSLIPSSTSSLSASVPSANETCRTWNQNRSQHHSHNKN